MAKKKPSKSGKRKKSTDDVLLEETENDVLLEEEDEVIEEDGEIEEDDDIDDLDDDDEIEEDDDIDDLDDDDEINEDDDIKDLDDDDEIEEDDDIDDLDDDDEIEEDDDIEDLDDDDELDEDDDIDDLDDDDELDEDKDEKPEKKSKSKKKSKKSGSSTLSGSAPAVVDADCEVCGKKIPTLDVSLGTVKKVDGMYICALCLPEVQEILDSKPARPTARSAMTLEERQADSRQKSADAKKKDNRLIIAYVGLVFLACLIIGGIVIYQKFFEKKKPSRPDIHERHEQSNWLQAGDTAFSSGNRANQGYMATKTDPARAAEKEQYITNTKIYLKMAVIYFIGQEGRVQYQMCDPERRGKKELFCPISLEAWNKEIGPDKKKLEKQTEKLIEIYKKLQTSMENRTPIEAGILKNFMDLEEKLFTDWENLAILIEDTLNEMTYPEGKSAEEFILSDGQRARTGGKMREVRLTLGAIRKFDD